MYTPWVAAGFLLFGLLPGLPYGYYQVLRWVVCLSAGYGAWKAHEQSRPRWRGTFIAVAILFNPLVPIYLPRSVWIPIDLVTAPLFLTARALYAEQVDPPPGEEE